VPPLSYHFPLRNLGKEAATLQIICSPVATIAKKIPEAPPADTSNGTLLLFHFYQDDIIIPFITYDQYFACFERLRLPLSARHLSALHTFPSSVEDFVRAHFVPPYFLPDNFDQQQIITMASPSHSFARLSNAAQPKIIVPPKAQQQQFLADSGSGIS
jgi:hypothetical protein